MSIRHSIYLVVSPRPRVGKTLLSRLLIDYHKHEERQVAGFDLNGGDHALKQFAPDDVAAADIGSVKGQMALFDHLVSEQGGGKVVDVGDDMFKEFFDLAFRIGLVEEAHKRNIAPVILFIVSSDKQAADAYADIRARFPGAALTPVHNEMLGLAQHRDRFPPSAESGAILRMPVLAPGLRKYIETPPFGFADAQLANARHIPLDGHIEIQRWLRKAYLEFRELDLRILLGQLQTSLRIG